MRLTVATASFLCVSFLQMRGTFDFLLAHLCAVLKQSLGGVVSNATVEAADHCHLS